MSARAVEALGANVVLLRDQAVLDALFLVRKGIETINVNSAHMPRFQALFREIARAYTRSSERHDRVVSLGALGESKNQGDVEWISTHEAADLVGLSVRQVQRLAPALGRSHGGRWQLDRSLVLTHKDLRQRENHDRADAA